MSIPEMDMNPEIARKLLEVGEEFRMARSSRTKKSKWAT